MSKPGLPLPSFTSRVCALITAWLALTPLLLQMPALLSLGIVAIALAVNALSWRKAFGAPLRLLLVLTMLGMVSWQMEIRFDRDTGCALLAAMMALKTSELHSVRDARSLLGFALFTPFSALILDQGPTTMVLALLVVPATLLSMQCLTQDQSQVPARLGRSQLSSIGQLTILGVPLTLAGFWLLPRLDAPLWGVPERAQVRPGLSDNMAPGAWIDLMSDETPALRVSFNGPTPPAGQRYWRGPVMWDFDGHSWQALPFAASLIPPTEFVPVTQHFNYRIDYEPTDQKYLVALDLPLTAPAGTRLTTERSLVADRRLSAITRWELQSASPASFQETLPPRQRQRALALPLRLNPRTVALGAQWRQEAGADDAAIVQRALNWVRTEFTYTLAATKRPGLHTVDEFLFRDKAGFCEQFSSSFVVLMRASGIPARVVTGYVGGIYNNLGHYWVIRRMDAHAWAEVWLPQRGWVRVDPTAAVAPERIRDTLEDRLAQNNNDASIDSHWRLADIGDWLRHSWNNLVLGFDAKRQQQLLHSFGINHLYVSQLMMLFIAFTSVSLGLMAWWLARGERERDALLRAWHRLDRHYARLGLGRTRHEPALVWAKRIEQQYPGIGLYILSQRFTDARYSSKDFDRNLINALLQHRPHTAVSNIENTFTCSIHRSLDVGCLHDSAKTTSRAIQRNHTK